MKKYEYVEVNVGSLPEWYNEAEHDYALELAIEDFWGKESHEVKVIYNYNNSYVQGWNSNGDKVFERETDLDYAFKAAKASQ